MLPLQFTVFLPFIGGLCLYGAAKLRVSAKPREALQDQLQKVRLIGLGSLLILIPMIEAKSQLIGLIMLSSSLGACFAWALRSIFVQFKARLAVPKRD